jgi:hypothetical protein
MVKISMLTMSVSAKELNTDAILLIPAHLGSDLQKKT